MSCVSYTSEVGSSTYVIYTKLNLILIQASSLVSRCEHPSERALASYEVDYKILEGNQDTEIIFKGGSQCTLARFSSSEYTIDLDASQSQTTHSQLAIVN